MWRTRGVELRHVASNDERDAIDPIDIPRLGRLPEAWIAPPATRQLREFVGSRAKRRSRSRRGGEHPPLVKPLTTDVLAGDVCVWESPPHTTEGGHHHGRVTGGFDTSRRVPCTPASVSSCGLGAAQRDGVRRRLHVVRSVAFVGVVGESPVRRTRRPGTWTTCRGRHRRTSVRSTSPIWSTATRPKRLI